MHFIQIIRNPEQTEGRHLPCMQTDTQSNKETCDIIVIIINSTKMSNVSLSQKRFQVLHTDNLEHWLQGCPGMSLQDLKSTVATGRPWNHKQ